MSVLTLYAHYFEEPDWLTLADRHAGDMINGVVASGGEVGEHIRQYGGGGPCFDYSYTGWAYVYTPASVSTAAPPSA